MTDIQIETRHTAPDAVLLSVSGELDTQSAELLDADIRRQMKAGQVTRLVVDLSQTTFVDSLGIAVLIHARKRATASGGQFRITNPSRNVHKVLQMTGVLAYLTEPPEPPVILGAKPDASDG
jgi:anti-anti-sigma factor